MQAGHQRYSTGVPCVNGHVAERWTPSGNCTACDAARRVTDAGRAAGWKRQGVKPTRARTERCELCGRPPVGKALCADHDHATGAFRGWLCHRCNMGLGLLGDDTVSIQRATHYLKGMQP